MRRLRSLTPSRRRRRRASRSCAAAGNTAGARSSSPRASRGSSPSAPTDTHDQAGSARSQQPPALTFYAPGCYLDTINPSTDTPRCCGNGTSQASAYTAGVLVALRSYDPALTPAAPSNACCRPPPTAISTSPPRSAPTASARSSTPAPPRPPSHRQPTTPATRHNYAATAPTPARAARPRAERQGVRWHAGCCASRLAASRSGAQLHVEVVFAHGKALYVATAHPTLHRRIRRPLRALLHLTEGGTAGATVTVKL